MQVSDAMSRNVSIASPNDTLQSVAQIMAEKDLGFLPVGENDRLIGTITDRDIVVRALAKGQAASAQVREAMTNEIKYCFEDEDLDQITMKMGDLKVRRLPVLSRAKRLVGILSIGDAAHGCPETAGAALHHVAETGGPHSQLAH
jgi:CBS domain-containing protein